MNKRYFIALVATFFMALGAIAQSNTYNMVLTLKDGTIITIGPNDLQQLDFKDDNVTVSGTNITDLMNSIKDMQDLLAAVKKQVDQTQMSVAEAVELSKKNKDDISSLKASVKALNESVDAKIAANYDKMKTYTDEAMKKTEAELKEYTNDAVNKLHAEIAENKEVITNEYNKAIDESKAEILALINALQTIIEQNTANIEKNTADIAGNKANIKTNTKNINTNKNAIQTLITQLRNLGVIPKN
ncbi:MAG: hypothetical protein IKQ58_01565 [Prevotella sp.]|nr:hypothetical protein [Prevotella sp.]